VVQVAVQAVRPGSAVHLLVRNLPALAAEFLVNEPRPRRADRTRLHCAAGEIPGDDLHIAPLPGRTL